MFTIHILSQNARKIGLNLLHCMTCYTANQNCICKCNRYYWKY